MTHLSRAIEAWADALRRLEQSGKRLNEWSALPNATKKKWIAKVEAIQSAFAAGGFVVVPKEPGEEIINAALDEHAKITPSESPFGPDGYFACIYRAMIAASQEPSNASD